MIAKDVAKAAKGANRAQHEQRANNHHHAPKEFIRDLQTRPCLRRC